MALAVLILILVLGVGCLLAAVPGVGNAPRLARAYLASHDATPVRVPPPEKISVAVIATEDHELGAPPGFDIVYGALRYLYAHILLGRPNQGGSTIPQQLAKRMYTGPGPGLANKAEQIGLALKLELTYGKSELLALYLDEGYYGQNAYGIEQASQTYFGRDAAALTWGEASLLAGLLQAPTAYDPYTHPRLALERRFEVVTGLVRIGTLTPAEGARIASEPLGLVPLRT